jgi:hypothetical protein
MAKSFLRQARVVVKSANVNIDNGNGTTIDEVLFNAGPTGARLVRVYFMYDEIAQTVAAGNFKLGVAVGGATLVAATAYTDAAAIGAVTTGTILVDVVPANTTVWFRHTGIAATATGTGKVYVEYVYDE